MSAQAVPTYPISDTDFEKLIKEYDKTINLLIKTVYNYDSSDVCYNKEDVYQDCLMSLFNAVKIYKPNKEMKFRTFVIMHLKSRIGNFRNKVVRKNLNGTIQMSELHGGWGITGREESCDDSDSQLSTRYNDFVGELIDGQDALNEIIDAKTILNKLTGHKKTLFSEYYIEGKKINEICKDNPDLKYYQIQRYNKQLEQIYKTLIKGDTPCLN